MSYLQFVGGGGPETKEIIISNRLTVHITM
jgi:hypothetical protein